MEESENNKNSNQEGKKKRHSTPAPVSAKLRSHFRVVRKLEPIFSGTQVRLTPDGRYLLCDCGESGVKIVDSRDSNVVGILRQEEEAITCFCTFSESEDEKMENSQFTVITASHNGLLRQWQVLVGREEEEEVESPMRANITLIRSWKAQPAIPAGRACSLEIDNSDTLLASGFTDGSLRVWDIRRKACTHVLRGHVGVVSLVRFFSKDGRHILLTSAAGDGQLRAWDLNSSSTPTFTQLNGHSSVVTDAVWSPNGNRLVTVGRDQLLVVWDGETFEKLRAWPCFEQLESLLICPIFKKGKSGEDAFQTITAGSRGQLRIWDVHSGKCLVQATPMTGNETTANKMETDSSQNQSIGFLSATKSGATSVLTLTTDHRLVFYEVVEDECTLVIEERKQIPGDVGEVLDISSIKTVDNQDTKTGLLAVATNSPLIRIYDSSNWSCTFLNGHHSAITSLASTLRGGVSLLVSGSRDNDVLVWKVGTNDDGKIRADVIAKAAGHTAAVLAVAAIPSGGDIFISAGADLTVKLWPMPSPTSHSTSPQPLSCLATVKAHDKDINSLALSPNGRFLASGSQDKTAKIWLIESDQSGVAGLQLLGTLRGHHRAIWSVDFSPIDQILATSSADGTLKLWALSNLACLKTFEGHDVAVLRCRFMNRGTQLVSGGADGVIKAWSIQTGECVSTLETGHDDRAWAVTPIADGQWLATGSADDRLIVWHDYTLEYVDECTKRDHARALDAQRLDNLLASRNFVEAFNLALSLNQPARLWRIVRELRISLNPLLSKIVADLDAASLASLIRIVSAWNTNTRFVLEAQYMLSTVLTVRPVDDLLAIVKNDVASPNQQMMRDAVEALIAYTQRHFARVDRLATQSAFTDFAWSQLKLLDEPPSAS